MRLSDERYVQDAWDPGVNAGDEANMWLADSALPNLKHIHDFAN